MFSSETKIFKAKVTNTDGIAQNFSKEIEEEFDNFFDALDFTEKTADYIRQNHKRQGSYTVSQEIIIPSETKDEFNVKLEKNWDSLDIEKFGEGDLKKFILDIPSAGDTKDYMNEKTMYLVSLRQLKLETIKINTYYNQYNEILFELADCSSFKYDSAYGFTLQMRRRHFVENNYDLTNLDMDDLKLFDSLVFVNNSVSRLKAQSSSYNLIIEINKEDTIFLRRSETDSSNQSSGFYSMSLKNFAKIEDFQDKSELYSATVSPLFDVLNNLFPSLEPNFIRISDIKMNNGYLLGKYKEEAYSSGRVSRLSSNRKLVRWVYLQPDKLTKHSLAALFCFHIPLLSKTLTVNAVNGEIPVFAHPTGVKGYFLGVLHENDKEEYKKQFKEACIQIIKGFDDGVYNSADEKILFWVKKMKELIEEEKKKGSH